MKTVVVFSGGLDSTTLLYHLRAEGHEVKALTIDYGQRHSREIQAAEKICALNGVEQKVVDLHGLVTIFGKNALTDHSLQVPGGEYQESTMVVTTVPNRNMILLSIAIGWAISLQFDSVAFGAHGGEYTPYADCTPEFAKALNGAAQVCDSKPVTVLSPFVTWDKGDIVKRGFELSVPFELTWSCYQGGDAPCGKCSTCRDRCDAFHNVDAIDPTGTC